MNIVFDLGGVVFVWRPDLLIAKVFSDNRTRGMVAADLLSHPDWAELDRGCIEKEEAVSRAAARSGIAADKIRELLNLVPDSLVPIQETISLISRLKTAGHRLFVLSNMHHDSANHLEKTYPIWDQFEGVVFSCREKLVKPQPEIFRLLINRYHLEPKETVFIDDTRVNLTAAQSLGLIPIHFSNALACEKELADLTRG